ncbi:tetratricopeptide repeat protein [Flavobacterium sp. NST-5]|uniref:Tetratricopeptide repeat protein n=2 Tax=Flavobacterium ichthyis TaxID=2698827 RepID=A0ABW9Z964_9FLAO|nr:tetratricopeptide repeat protein [Flavobacterium ichthyis]
MKQLIVLFLMMVPGLLQSQEKDKNLPKGNDDFANKKFAEAEAEYRISASKNPENAMANYNLGNSIYKQKQHAEAKRAYLTTIEKTTDKVQKHKAFHNLGNIFMTEKKYSEAVEAYKNALRNNPADEETRYNYALAKEYLKNNPEPPKDKDKDKKDQNKDQNKDQKDKNQGNDQQDKNQNQDQDKGKDKNDKKDGNKDQNQNQKPEEKDNNGQPKPQPGNSPSKQRMENLLDAVNNEEKKIQDKINAKKTKGRPVPTEKDW